MVSVNKVNTDKGIFSLSGSNSVAEKKVDSDFFNIFSSISSDNLLNKEKFDNLDSSLISNNLDLSFLPLDFNKLNQNSQIDNSENTLFSSEIGYEYESLDSILSQLNFDSPKINQNKADEIVNGIVSKFSTKSINEQFDFGEFGDNIQQELDTIYNHNLGLLSDSATFASSKLSELTDSIASEISNKIIIDSNLIDANIDIDSQIISDSKETPLNQNNDEIQTSQTQELKNEFKLDYKSEIAKVINDTLESNFSKNLPDNSKGIVEVEDYLITINKSDIQRLSSTITNEISIKLKSDLSGANTYIKDNVNIVDQISNIISNKLGINLEKFSPNNKVEFDIRPNQSNFDVTIGEKQPNIIGIEEQIKIKVKSEFPAEISSQSILNQVSYNDNAQESIKELDNLAENLSINDRLESDSDNNFNQSNNNSQKQNKSNNPIVENLININQAQNLPINKTESNSIEANIPKSLTYISKLSELSNKISTIVNKSADGETSIARINLTPKTLGTLVVEISQSKDDLKIIINAESKDVANLIEQNIGGLKEKLINQGINSQNIELNINVQTQTATLMNKGENREDKGATRQDKRQSKYSKSSEILNDIDQSTLNYTKYDSGKFIEKYI